MEKAHPSTVEPGWFSMADAARYTGISYTRIREAAYRDNDPLPVRMHRDNRKKLTINRKELEEWMLRNAPRVN